MTNSNTSTSEEENTTTEETTSDTSTSPVEVASSEAAQAGKVVETDSSEESVDPSSEEQSDETTEDGVGNLTSSAQTSDAVDSESSTTTDTEEEVIETAETVNTLSTEVEDPDLAPISESGPVGITSISIEGVVLSLEAFEGPMHLLLHLIHEQNIDIMDIPIHKIANDFQAYVDVIHTLDLDLAGDYLTMAAELTAIKSRMLIPRNPEEEDPRDDLVQRLLEYKQVRNATRFLKKQKKLGVDVFIRGTDAVGGLPDMPLPKARVKSNELMDIFAKLLSKFAYNAGPFHAINFEKITVRQQIDWVCQRFGDEVGDVMFSELFSDLGSRLHVIVTFLALLELSRLNHIKLEQSEERDDIRICAMHALNNLQLGEIDSFDYSQEQQELKSS